uniref:Grass carp reovirus (GCRV)-induced gene 2e n=1 Tax=Echeneis naucrates TaxID=173247 RepID=A0A665T8I8_ECHNA
MSRFQWAEDDFDVPRGAFRLSEPQPRDDKTYVMYHGTTSRNAQRIRTSGFQQSADGMLGPGVYLSRDLQKASRYPIDHPEYDRVVIKVTVKVGKVVVINRQGHPLQKTWHAHGYDTAWVPPNCGMVKSGLEENCIWDPRRIEIINFIKPLPLSEPQPRDDKTYVMYHGTTSRNAQRIRTSGFQQSADGMLGPGVYLSRDLQKASRYPIDHPEYDRVVIKVTVKVGKVVVINRQGHPLQKTWHAHGYDTAWVPPNCGMVKSGLEENCIWDPRQIEIINFIKPFVSLTLHDLKQWAEDDFDVPRGAFRLSEPQPRDDKTYVMYHGTTSRNAQRIRTSGFQQSADGMLGPGVYLSRDLQKASRYPIDHPEYDRVVIKVTVKVGKVVVINRQGHPLQKTWHAHGYDTAWVPPNCGMVKSGLEENCIWDPRQIEIINFIKPLPPQPRDDKTYVMYHGTTSRNAQRIRTSGFQQSADGMLGPGVYLSRDLQKASRYPIDHPEYDRVVIKVTVKVGKVVVINRQGHPLQKTWHAHGYDTAWVPPNCGMVKSGLEENCIWDPRRIEIINFIKPLPVPPQCGAWGYQ